MTEDLALNLLLFRLLMLGLVAATCGWLVLSSRSDRALRRTLNHILEGLENMATQADLDAAVAALSTAFNTGFDALEASIATEVTAIQAAITAAAASGASIPQASVDAINAAAANITAKLTQAQTDIGSELPAAAPAPTAG